MTTNLYEAFGLEKPTHFPEMPDAANLVASLFQMLGGTLHIDETGARRMMIPEPCSFGLQDKELPSLPNAKPHEQFHRSDEFRGAMKLVTGLLSRLHPNDRTFVWDAYAYVCTPLQISEAKAAMPAGREAE